MFFDRERIHRGNGTWWISEGVRVERQRHGRRARSKYYPVMNVHQVRFFRRSRMTCSSSSRRASWRRTTTTKTGRSISERWALNARCVVALFGFMLQLAQLLPMEENFLLLFRFDNPLESSVEFMKVGKRSLSLVVTRIGFFADLERVRHGWQRLYRGWWAQGSESWCYAKSVVTLEKNVN